jgi:hypothetical protein
MGYTYKFVVFSYSMLMREKRNKLMFAFIKHFIIIDIMPDVLIIYFLSDFRALTKQRLIQELYVVFL